MTRLVVITGFIVSFLAGTMAGIVFVGARSPRGGPMTGGRESFLANQLDLTADQQAKMKAIWQDVSHHGGPDQRGRRAQLRHDQEDAVAKLVRPEDKSAYDRCVADFHDKLDRLDADNRHAFQQAVDKTKTILTPDQLKKYEAFLSRGPGGDRDHASTKPADVAAKPE